MRQLRISRNGLELAAVSLKQSVSTLGRSPSCDGVLRAPGVRPVHFLLEEQGAGSNQWVLFDISNESGEGVVLSQGRTEFKGFHFDVGEAPLDSGEEIGGGIQRSLQGAAATGAAPVRPKLVEAVRIRRDSGAVQEVSHLVIPGFSLFGPKKMRPFEEIASILLVLSKGVVRVELRAARSGSQAAVQRAVLIKNSNPSEVQPGASVELAPSDWIRMEYGPDDLYFRWVSPVPRAEIPRDVIGNPILRLGFFAGFLVAGLAAAWISWKIRNPEVQMPMQPPRIAKIEVKEAPPPPPPPPPPREAPKPADPAPAKVQNAATNSAPKAAAPDRTAAKPVKPGLVAPVAPTDVNQLGLLGAMKASAPKQGEGVRADQIYDDGVVSQAAAGSSGSIALKTPPSGALDVGKAGGAKAARGDGLQALATTMKGGDAMAPKNVGPVVSGSGGKLLGSGLDGLGSLTGSAAGKAGAGGLEDGSGTEVQGGLDRETVRRVIKSNRGKIQACYERALMTSPKLAGRVVTLFEISAKGPVLTASVKSSDAQSKTLESCLIEVVRGMEFPVAANGMGTRVIYPFVFQARGN